MAEPVKNAAIIAVVVILLAVGGKFFLKSSGNSTAAPDMGPVVVDTSTPVAAGVQVEIQPENVGQPATR